MSGLTIAWEYLTGYVVATDPSSRERAEWPPHPARVFMAMAAAWFETPPDQEASDEVKQAHEQQGQALRWLETLDDPQLILPPADGEAERSLATVYVPVNDKAGPASATLQSAPALTRGRQPRTFPRRYVGSQPCQLHWDDADGLDSYRDPLSELCSKVTRVGHSSSLVCMWVVEPNEATEFESGERWKPSDAISTGHCRVIRPGILDSLPDQTQIPQIEAFAEAMWGVEDADFAARQAKLTNDAHAKKQANRKLKDAKADFEKTFGTRWKKSLSPPPRLRPRLGLWTGYQRIDHDVTEHPCGHTNFDADLLVLTRVGGPQLPAVSTLAVTRALRGTIMAHCGEGNVPTWVSGHRSDGGPNDDQQGHLSLLPLPSVGHEHADGHLLGAALAFPRHVDRRERGRVLGSLLLNRMGEPQDIALKLGRLGVWVLRKRDWSDNRHGLRPQTWTKAPAGTTTWASVTPVVLDKFPKADRGDPHQRDRWESEVRGIVANACVRIGLPKPAQIDVDRTCWHRGGARALTKQRRLRTQHSRGHDSAPLGDGFPFYPTKGTNTPRPQVHVLVRFAEPVVGPILLGAGRFMGYGLLKPWESQA